VSRRLKFAVFMRAPPKELAEMSNREKAQQEQNEDRIEALGCLLKSCRDSDQEEYEITTFRGSAVALPNGFRFSNPRRTKASRGSYGSLGGFVLALFDRVVSYQSPEGSSYVVPFTGKERRGHRTRNFITAAQAFSADSGW
jgi:hypothetical protein